MPRALQWEKVPKGARSSVCRGEGCGRQIYWIERAPDSMSEGWGINHFQNCVASEDF